MHYRHIAWALVCVGLTAFCATAQQNPQYPPNQYPPPANNNQYPPPPTDNVQPGAPAQPDQPVQPQLPNIERRDVQPGMPQQQPGIPQPGNGQPPQPPPPPFQLTPQEELQVDQVLYAWEARNKGIKTFDCRFKRWVYDSVFGPADQAKFVELGVMRYASPDRGMFRVESAEDNAGHVGEIDPRRAEHWVADGKSIIEFNHPAKTVTVHKLPPEMQGRAIADTPLPFLFSSEAKKLRERYFIRVITPQNAQGETWIEAYPRHQQEAANFHHAQFIITSQKMEPYALKLVLPNQKNYVVYRFYEIVINDPMPKIFRGGDPFKPPTPWGWKKMVEEPQSAQAQRTPNDRRR
jgi:TIGR03009 family protein